MNTILNLYELTGAGSSLSAGYDIAKNLTHPGKFLNMLANASPVSSAVSREAMTMEEYKQYLYDQISRIPRHPSRALESISISITEDGEKLFREKSKDSFWERRAESQKLYQEQRQMAALEWYYRQQNPQFYPTISR